MTTQVRPFGPQVAHPRAIRGFHAPSVTGVTGVGPGISPNGLSLTRSRRLGRMSARRTDKLKPASIISHLGVMVVLVAGLAIPFAGVAGVGARDVARSMDKIPADLEAEPLPQRTRLVARNGATLATLYDENRVNVPLAKVAPIMRKAIVSIE